MAKMKKKKKAKKVHKHKNIKHTKKLSNLTANKAAAPEIKISEAILKLSEPLRKRYRESHRIQGIIFLTIMAWNISLFPEDEQQHVQGMLIDSLQKQLGGEDVAILLNCIDTLIERKKQDYPNVNDYIVDYNLSISGDTLTLAVKSATIHGKIQRRS